MRWKQGLMCLSHRGTKRVDMFGAPPAFSPCCRKSFLATHEANAHIHHKQRVQCANADDTVYTTLFKRNWHEPAPVRVLPNATLAGKYEGREPGTVIGYQDGQEVFVYSTDSPLADATGEVDDMALYCGQSCGQFSNILGAQERINTILDEAAGILRGFREPL